MALARLSIPAARAKRLIGSAGGSIDRPQCIEHYRISVIGQVRLPVKRRHMHFGERSSILESILTSVLGRMGRRSVLRLCDTFRPPFRMVQRAAQPTRRLSACGSGIPQPNPELRSEVLFRYW